MNKESTALLWPIVVFAATALVLIALFVKLFQVADAPAALVIAIAAVAGLLILSPRVFDLIELTVSNTGLTAKIRDVEKKVEEAKQEIEQTGQKIDQIFARTMSPAMFENLRKLSSGSFGRYKTTDSGLVRELRHLRDVGYIQVRGNIANLPREGEDLSQYVTVTPVGKEFVALRESLEQEP
jgi:hypothetical protein